MCCFFLVGKIIHKSQMGDFALPWLKTTENSWEWPNTLQFHPRNEFKFSRVLEVISLTMKWPNQLARSFVVLNFWYTSDLHQRLLDGFFFMWMLQVVFVPSIQMAQPRTNSGIATSRTSGLCVASARRKLMSRFFFPLLYEWNICINWNIEKDDKDMGMHPKIGISESWGVLLFWPF